MHRGAAVFHKGRVAVISPLGCRCDRHDEHAGSQLAREAELCYATLALATDYDCWHETEEAVTVEAILATLHQNVALAKRILRAVVPAVVSSRSCVCNDALRNAIVTPASYISSSSRRRVGLLIGRYIRKTKKER